FSSSAFRDSRMRPRSSTSSSLTRTWSPFFTTSSVRSVRPCCNSEMCNSPSTPGRISTKAPNAVVLFTTPSYTLPTSGVWIIAATMSRARSPPSPTAEMVTMPLSSTLISAPVCSWMLRIVLPLGPIRSPILSTVIWIVMIRGAYLESDERDAGAGPRHRHAGIEQRQRAPAHGRHRGRAVGLEDVGDDADRVRERFVRRQQGLERALGEGAVPHLAPRRPANRPHFTGRERREVIVEHERLGRLLRHVDRVDALLVLHRPQR